MILFWLFIWWSPFSITNGVIECIVKCWCFNPYTMWALALQMEMGRHKDWGRLWPGWELNPRLSGLITTAPPTELQGQTGAGRGKWRFSISPLATFGIPRHDSLNGKIFFLFSPLFLLWQNKLKLKLNWNVVWGSCDVKLADKLQKLQNRAARAMITQAMMPMRRSYSKIKKEKP